MQPANPSTDVDAVPALTPSEGGLAAEAAFWGTNSYRSGGTDWREFLAIDGDRDDDAEFAASFAAAQETQTAPPDVVATKSAMEPDIAPESAPARESDTFGSWTAAPDDFLPSR